MGNQVTNSIFLILFFFVTGCSAFNANVYVPLKNVKIAIEQSKESCPEVSGFLHINSLSFNFPPDVLYGSNDMVFFCKNYEKRPISYHMALQRQGIESCVVFGVLSFYSRPVLHCWNEVLCPEDGKWKLVDVNSLTGLDGWDVEQYPEHIPYLKFKGRVTNQNIRQEKGYYWKSNKNMSDLMENCQVNWMPIISEFNFIF